jgi:hypothetical protein
MDLYPQHDDPTTAASVLQAAASSGDTTLRAAEQSARLPLSRKADNTVGRPIALPNFNHPPQDRQRVRRACEGCRKKKIKCMLWIPVQRTIILTIDSGNGEEPCQRCLSYRVDCEYADYIAPLKTIDAR